MTKWVVVVPLELDVVYGPFDTEKEARDWASLQFADLNWEWDVWPIRAPILRK